MATAKSQVSSIDDQPEDTQSAPAAVVGGGLPGASGKRELLTIYSSSEAGGSDPVSCGINGYAFVIKRDIPVNVPTELVGMLKNCITTTYIDGKPIDRPLYAFSSQPA